MKKIILQSKTDSFQWVDITDPSETDLKEVAKTYDLPPSVVEDCLDPGHLPKYEKTDSYTFLILRAYDEKATKDADTVQELTRKLSIFVGKNFILTLHRKDQIYLEQLRQQWGSKSDLSVNSSNLLISDLIGSVVWSYETPLNDMQIKLDELETKLFSTRGSSAIIQQGYYLRRKSAVIKRMLRFSLDVLPRLNTGQVRESLDSLYFYADEVLDNVNSLINLHITLASQKTNEASHRSNEVMRVLTIFSVFFLPLNFIASIYGMNFEYMPELKHHLGYYGVLGAMFVVATAIYLWFRRQHWL